MKLLMPQNFLPNDVFRCQFYTCKADEWFGKFVLIVSLQANGITPSAPSYSDQWFNFLFALPIKALFAWEFLHRAFTEHHFHYKQEFLIGNLSVMVSTCPSMGTDDPLWPDFLHQYYGERPPLTGPKNGLCCLLCFQLSTPTSLAPGTGFEKTVFHRLRQGVALGWFKSITFTVHFISILITPAPPQIIRH